VERLEQLKQRAEAARGDGMLGHAMDACKEALELLQVCAAESDSEHRATEFRLLCGDIAWDAGDLHEALRYYQEAIVEDPESLDASAAIGFVLFHMCRFTAARATLEAISAEAPDMPDVWYYLGLLAQRAGEPGLESYAFQKAARIDSERYPVPIEVTREEVEAMLSEMIDSLPRPLHKALSNVPILLEDLPNDSILFSEDPPLDPLLLGLFTGQPLDEQSAFNQPADITRILLFKKNIERVAPNPDALRRELWITLKHEIGHYWGLDEDELAARGLE